MHLYKIIDIFHKNHLEKTIAMLSSIDFTPPMTKLMVKPLINITKRK